MKKTLIFTVMFAISGLLMQACYDTPNYFDDFTEVLPDKVPNIGIATGNDSQYKPGETAKFMVQYFSEAEIDKITLDEIIVLPNDDTSRNQVTAYSDSDAHYVDSLKVKVLDIEYLVPGPYPDDTKITLMTKVISVNSLADSASVSFTIKN